MNPFTKEWLADYHAKRAKSLQEPLPYEKTGKELKSPVQVKQRAGPSHLEVKFEELWKILKGPPLEREFKFHEKRKWRFDFAILGNKVAIELDGGCWSQGRHTRGSGFIKDCEKFNQAALLGYRVFRLTSEMINRDNILPIIELCRKETKMLEELGI